MLPRAPVAVCFLFVLAGAVLAPAQNDVPRPVGVSRPDEAPETPILRLDPGGPTARVNALAFSPDGRTLYGAGFDKVVRTWVLDADGTHFVPADKAYRVPVGPGTTGTINCLAVSPDGKWLAASGVGVTLLESDFRTVGRVFDLPLTGLRSFQERSLIYVFRTGSGMARVLRGHVGPVYKLAFAPDETGPPLLVSAARDRWGSQTRPGGDVRVWDLGKEPDRAQVTARHLDAVGPTDHPALAVRRTGPGPEDLRVVLGWGDGRLRLWDVAREQLQEGPADVDQDGQVQTAAFLPSRGPAEEAQLLTTGWKEKFGGRLRLWSDRAGAGLQELRRLRVQTGEEAAAKFPVPCALALVSSGPGRDLDLAAMVVRLRDGTEDQYGLRLVDCSLARQRDWSYPLWRGLRRDTVLAASPGGRFLAVAHTEKPEVWVYSVGALVKAQGGEGTPRVLRGLGATVHSVGFARKGPNSRGLYLRFTLPDATDETAPGKDQELFFDFRKDKGQQGWKVVSPDWTVRDVTPQGRPSPRVFAWQGAGRKQQQVEVLLLAGEQVTACTLVPPLNGGPPVLAVAAYAPRNAEPRLALYDARTGTQLRQLFGHVSPIHSLAADPDGRLLASAAEDETVCLWSTTDLHTVLGQNATLGGVRFALDDPAAVVEAVTNPGTAGELHKGDRVTGVTLEGKEVPRPVAATLDLYQEVWHARPGDPLQLQLVRAGKPASARVVAQQGVDGRTPLLSLFLVAGARAGEPGWIAWTPAGQFDRSSADVEKYVGWQFNPARPGKEPPRFSPLKDYREQNYKPRLLEVVAAKADLDEVRKALAELEAIPRPEVAIDFPGSDQVPKGLDGAAYLVSTPEVRLRLTVRGPSLQKGQVESVRLEGDGPPRSLNLEAAAGQELSVPVTLKKRGYQTFTVTVRTKSLQEATHDVTLRYQPARPLIRVEYVPPEGGKPRELPKGPPLVVHQKEVKVHARLLPDAPGQEVRWSKAQLNETNLPLKAGPRGPDLEATLQLDPGDNKLVLEGVNDDAPPGAVDVETASETRVLKFQEEKTPVASFQEVVLVAEGEAEALHRRVPANPDGTQTVDTQEVRLIGLVTAQQPLARISLRIGSNDPVEAKGQREGNEGKTFHLDHPLTLEPDKPVTVVLEAQTQFSELGKARLTLNFKPALPEFDLTKPADGDEVIDREHKPVGEIDVKGRLTLRNAYPFKVLLWVSRMGQPAEPGKETPPDSEVPSTKLGGGAAEPLRLATLRLEPGRNRIKVQLTNEWGRAGEPVVRYVSYLRPPRILTLSVPREVDGPFVRVEATVRSPTELPLTKVVVNGKEYGPPRPQADPASGLSTWTVVVDEVGLGGPGRHPVLFEVHNQDGSDVQTAQVEVARPSPAEPPRIRLLNGPSDGKVSGSRFFLKMRVESLSPLRDLRLIQGTTSQDLLARKPAKKVGPRFEWEDDKVLLTLAEGDNVLEIKAVNKGGPTSAPLTLNYVRPPGHLLLALGPEGPPARRSLRGSIRWKTAEEAEQGEKRFGQIQVYVNDRLQAAPAVGPPSPDGLEKTFEVGLVLSAPQNRVEIDCPFPLEDDSQRTTLVPCLRPEPPGTLRVLLVNAGQEQVTDEVLRTRAVKALHLEAGNGSEFHSRAFGRVVLYPNPRGRFFPLSHNVTGQLVNYWLDEVIGPNILQDARGNGGTNDVVVIYWLGKDLVQDPNNGDWYLPTGTGQGPARPGQPLRTLVTPSHRVPGARVLLLDVARPEAQGQAEVDWSDSRAAVLRYVWARDAVRAPGLLEALNRATEGTDSVSLEAWAKTAGQLAADFRKQYEVAIDLTKHIPPDLASLVVTRPVKP